VSGRLAVPVNSGLIWGSLGTVKCDKVGRASDGFGGGSDSRGPKISVKLGRICGRS
jgi:hypothetical protein